MKRALAAILALGTCWACQPVTNGTAPGTATNQGDAGPEVSQGGVDPAWKPAGDKVTWSGMTFTVPSGMTGKDLSTRYEMVDPGDGKGLNACSITINKPMPAAGDLAKQARDLLTQAYEAQGYQVLDDNYGKDLLAHRTSGTSSAGWSYVELRAELRKNEPSPERGHIMLIGLGDEVIPIVGYSPTSSGCTQLDHDFKTGIAGEIRWRELAYGLELAVTRKAEAPSVVGEWSLLEGASGQEYVFAANGRYGFGGALARERRGSDPETSSFTGDGAWSIEGDVLTLRPNDGAAEAMYFRVFDHHAVSPSKVVSHSVKLGLMKKDASGLYEVALVKK